MVMVDNMQELSEIKMHVSKVISQLKNCEKSALNWAATNDSVVSSSTHFMPGKSRTKGTAVGTEENTVDNNDFLLAVSSGIMCRHLPDLVTAGDINNSKGLQFVTSRLI